MGKKSKQCSKSPSRRILWYAFGAAGLGSRALAAFALVAIAMMLCSVKKESKIFNECVEEAKETGKSSSKAVHFCNGGR